MLVVARVPQDPTGRFASDYRSLFAASPTAGAVPCRVGFLAARRRRRLAGPPSLCGNSGTSSQDMVPAQAELRPISLMPSVYFRSYAFGHIMVEAGVSSCSAGALACTETVASSDYPVGWVGSRCKGPS